MTEQPGGEDHINWICQGDELVAVESLKRCLHELPSKEAQELLLLVIPKMRSGISKRIAKIYLGYLGCHAFEDDLLKELETDSVVGTGALVALANLGNQHAIRCLFEALDSDDQSSHLEIVGCAANCKKFYGCSDRIKLKAALREA